MKVINEFLQDGDIQLCQLLEAVGEYKDLDEQMSKFFPSIWNDLKGIFQMYFPIASSINSKETQMLTSKIKGLDLEVRINASAGRNAWTLPAVESTGGATALMVTGPVGLLFFILNGMTKMSKFSNQMFTQTKILPNKVVKFPELPVKFLVFETKGMLQDMAPEQRTAVILHELGHWSYIAPVLQSSTAQLISLVRIFPAAAPVALPFLIASIAYSREAEWKADSFAKKFGYAKELSDALQQIGLTVRQDVSWYNQVGDWITKLIMTIQNAVDLFLPIMGHPSIKRRKEALAAPALYKLLNLAKPICNKIDAGLSGKVHKLFTK
jgi:Zn-dependent protease with chaperone function